jgi:hypothetical protein
MSNLERAPQGKIGVKQNLISNGVPTLQRRSDCTVRALATLTDTVYGVMEEWLKANGRRLNCAFNLYGYLEKHPSAFGWKFSPKPELCSWPLWDWPKGRFLVVTSTHCYAIIDGQRFDTWLDKRRPECVYEVTPTEVTEASRPFWERSKFLSQF